MIDESGDVRKDTLTVQSLFVPAGVIGRRKNLFVGGFERVYSCYFSYLTCYMLVFTCLHPAMYLLHTCIHPATRGGGKYILILLKK